MRFLTIAAIALLASGAQAQRTTRPNLKLGANTERNAGPKAAFDGDTLFVKEADMVAEQIRVSGYEKTLRSSIESMFINNESDRKIKCVGITINYYDNNGRQLHQRSETVKVSIPPHQTRMIRISSWDKQRVWYYYRSERPNPKGQATPYKVSADIDFVIVDP